MIIIDYWFYKIYSMLLTKRRKNEPIIETLSFMVFPTTLYVLGILRLFGIEIAESKIGFQVAIIMAVIFFIFYLIFIRNKRYKKIIKRFKGEKMALKIIGYGLLIIFSFTPMIFLLTVGPRN